MTTRNLVALSVALAAGLLSAAPATAQSRTAPAVERLAAASNGPIAAQRNPTTKRPYFVTGRVPASSFSNATSSAGRAADFWASYGAIFGVREPSTELVLAKQNTDRYGVTHLRYDQRYQGLAVHGQQLLVHLQRDQVIAANGHFAEGIKLSTTPAVSAVGAGWVAAGAVPARGRKQSVGAPTLLVHVDGLGRTRLAWSTKVATGDPIGVWRIFVDAQTGEVLRSYNDLHTAKRRFTFTNGNDPDCPAQGPPFCELPGAEQRTEDGPPSADQDVEAAHTHAGTVYDYYFTKFGRDSYNANGHDLLSTVHFGVGYNNAFWCDDACAPFFGSTRGGQMVFGDGDGTDFSPLGRDLDVVAHELTHAVTGHHANLEYFGQSGALNESYSDVFAAMVDTNGGEWLIGEDSFTPGIAGDALRNMENPSAGQQPGHMSHYVHTTFDNAGVHTNSGIPNHAAYLAATHPTYGIGRDALEDIYYWALTACLNPFSDFLENLQCLLLGAQVVYPGDTAKAAAIRLSQSDVGVALKPAVTSPNGGESLAPGAPANVTWNGGGQTGRPFSVYVFQSAPATYVEGFESGPPLPTGFAPGGDLPWDVTAETAGGGLKSVRSAAIDNGERSELHLVVSLRSDSQITFKRLVSTQFESDFFSFHVDGIPIFLSSGIGSWGTPSSFPIDVPAGTHELVWVYQKDSSGSAGLDAAFIDDLQIPNLERATVNVINGATPADATSQSWTTPNAPGSTYRIRIYRHGTAPWLAFDESDNAFTVLDTQAPTDPTVQSTSHRPGVASRDRTVDVTWSGATDNHSGVDGFSYLWDRQPTTLPDPIEDAEETAARTTSPALANGRWYFHLRTRDNAGNWSSSRHVGPFVIVSAPVRCVVPNVKRKTVPQARRVLASKRCALGRVTRAYSIKVKAGRIISQSRRPGARLARGTKVKVVVSRGKRRR